MNRASAIVPFLVLAVTTSVNAIEIEFDYAFDRASPSSFFTNADDPLQAEKLAAMEAAASFFERLLLDDLDAVRVWDDPTEDGSALLGGPTDGHAPCPTNTWTLKTVNPNTGDPAELVDISLPEDTIVVFIGARDLPNDQVATMEDAAAYVCGAPEWLPAVATRGESNAPGK